MAEKSITLASIQDLLGAKLIGDASCVITGIASLHHARAGHITFLDNPKYKQYLASSNASCVIVSAAFAEACQTNALVVDNPYYAYAKVAQLFLPVRRFNSGIHQTAVVGEGCNIHDSVSIGAHVVIGDNCVIQAGSVIEPGCVINEGCSIGANTHFYPRVTLYHHCEVGANVIIHAGAVIGSDGFGFAKYQRAWHKVPQLGRVVIEDNVEIGANTTIDRGALDDTIIGADVKLDNQIQIAHNVEIGEHTAIAGCTGVAGSSKIGKDCLIGGNSGIGGHIEIADNVAITAMTPVIKSIKKPGVYSALMPAQPDKIWKRNLARFHQLDKQHEKIKALEHLYLASNPATEE